MAGRELREPPLLWLAHYPRMLQAYLGRGEDGLAELEEELRTRASARPGGKFGKREAAYVPFVPLPPLEWRHRCGSCRFWVDEGPEKPGECMIVGRTGDPFGGKAIHEEAGCALFIPPAGESAFAWLREQFDPTGADLVRGEFHARERQGVRIPVTDEGSGADSGSAPGDAAEDYEAAEAVGGTADREPSGPRRHTITPDVGTDLVPAGRRVDLELVADGLAAPVDCVADPGGDRLFVADQEGLVHVLEGESTVEGRGKVEDGGEGRRPEPLLDLRERTVDLQTQYDERGLLGLALHPGFADNGRIFVRYSAPPREGGPKHRGTPPSHDHTEVLAEFRVDEDRSPVDPADERAILVIPHPKFNHNAGDLAFGPEGYLYVSMGDGGGQGDTGFGHVEGGNAQDVTRNVLGSILRLDVDSDAETPPEWTGNERANPRCDEPYAVPEDNPLAGETVESSQVGRTPGIDELYAWGLRNPWRISFDSEGRLFVGDVGQHLFEEVHVVEKGGNYGWPIREGYHCFDPETPTEPPGDCPDANRRGEPLIDPILEYPHVDGGDVIGSAIVGGHVYEGSAIPELRDAYVFGDWTTTQDRPSGRLFAAQPPAGDDPEWEIEELVVAGSPNGRPNRHVLGFGRDADGELLLCSSETHVPKGRTGAVHRIVPPR